LYATGRIINQWYYSFDIGNSFFEYKLEKENKNKKETKTGNKVMRQVDKKETNKKEQKLSPNLYSFSVLTSESLLDIDIFYIFLLLRAVTVAHKN